MPALEEIDLVHDAVLWKKVGHGVNAEEVFAYPVPIRCRWVERRTTALDATGNTISIDAQIAVSCVDVPLDSVMWKGRIEDIPGTADPPSPTGGFMQVKSRSISEDLWGDRRRTELGAQRYRDTLPTVLDAGQELS